MARIRPWTPWVARNNDSSSLSSLQSVCVCSNLVRASWTMNTIRGRRLRSLIGVDSGTTSAPNTRQGQLTISVTQDTNCKLSFSSLLKCAYVPHPCLSLYRSSIVQVCLSWDGEIPVATFSHRAFMSTIAVVHAVLVSGESLWMLNTLHPRSPVHTKYSTLVAQEACWGMWT